MIKINLAKSLSLMAIMGVAASFVSLSNHTNAATAVNQVDANIEARLADMNSTLTAIKTDPIVAFTQQNSALTGAALDTKLAEFMASKTYLEQVAKSAPQQTINIPIDNGMSAFPKRQSDSKVLALSLNTQGFDCGANAPKFSPIDIARSRFISQVNAHYSENGQLVDPPTHKCLDCDIDVTIWGDPHECSTFVGTITRHPLAFYLVKAKGFQVAAHTALWPGSNVARIMDKVYINISSNPKNPANAPIRRIVFDKITGIESDNQVPLLGNTRVIGGIGSKRLAIVAFGKHLMTLSAQDGYINSNYKITGPINQVVAGDNSQFDYPQGQSATLWTQFLTKGVMFSPSYDVANAATLDPSFYRGNPVAPDGFVSISQRVANMKAKDICPKLATMTDGEYSAWVRANSNTTRTQTAIQAYLDNLKVQQAAAIAKINADNIAAQIKDFQDSKIAYAKELYLKYLGRALRTDEEKFWTPTNVTMASMEPAVKNSPEAKIKLAAGFYEQYLGRPIQEGEKNNWINVPREQIEPAIKNSQEAKEYTAMQVAAPIYQELLKRPIRRDEGRNWVGQTPQQIRTNVLASAEYKNVFITDCYNKYLGRAPEPGALTSWSRFSLEVIDREIKNSPEATARAAQ
ncbi:MAG: hypothetical protein K2X66_09960 [Cyanobacteria bacterium]|nr:hypothetical protein [Cyanobacteriota bacterium]